MKYIILCIPIVYLMCAFMVNNQDQKMAQRYQYELKFVAEEAAAAAAQYFNKQQYALGKYEFNRVEGIRAAEYVIKKNMKLDNDFKPTPSNYWKDKVSYTIEFYDDSNTVYPKLYSHPSGSFTLAIGDPTVIVTINAGQARFRLITPPTLFRTAAHTMKQR